MLETRFLNLIQIHAQWRPKYSHGKGYCLDLNLLVHCNFAIGKIKICISFSAILQITDLCLAGLDKDILVGWIFVLTIDEI